MHRYRSAFFNHFAEWLILLILFLFPFLGYLPHPTLILTALVSLAELLWLWKRKIGKRRERPKTVDFCVLFLSLAFLCSGILTSGAFGEGLVRALLLLMYFPTKRFFEGDSWKKRGVFALQFSGGIAAFLGIFQYFSGKAQLKWVDLSRFSDIGGRVTGGFENPNVFSIYLLLIFPLSLTAIFRRKALFYERIFSLICFLAELLCLVFTWSRGAWLSAILVLLLFFFFFSKRTRKYLGLAFLPLLILSFYLPRNIVNRFQSIGNLKETSIRYRLLVWEGVWRMLCEHPFGIGLGQARFSECYLPYAVKGTETVIHSHQILLQILCELGVIGLLWGLVGLTSLLYGVFFASKGDPLCRFGGGLGLLGVLAAGLFDNVWYHFGVFCLFWIFAAFSASGVPKDEKRGKKAFEAPI